MRLDLRWSHQTGINRAGDQCIGGWAQTRKGYVDHLEPGSHIHDRHAKMRRASDTRAAEIQLARIGLRIGHQVGE